MFFKLKLPPGLSFEKWELFSTAGWELFSTAMQAQNGIKNDRLGDENEVSKSVIFGVQIEICKKMQVAVLKSSHPLFPIIKNGFMRKNSKTGWPLKVKRGWPLKVNTHGAI